MCRPFMYVYPDCGHFVGGRDFYIMDRCFKARATVRECWIPREIALAIAEKRKWPRKGGLDGCRECHMEAQQVMHREGREWERPPKNPQEKNAENDKEIAHAEKPKEN